jgi:hypothetical protein
MPGDATSGADQRSVIFHLRLLLVLAVAFVVGAGLFAASALRRLDRVVAVVENVNAKVDRFAEAAAPLGKAAVDKGVEALGAVDTDDLGQSATEGVKEIGRVAKQRVIDTLKEQREKGQKRADEGKAP